MDIGHETAEGWLKDIIANANELLGNAERFDDAYTIARLREIENELSEMTDSLDD